MSTLFCIKSAKYQEKQSKCAVLYLIIHDRKAFVFVRNIMTFRPYSGLERD